MLFKIDENLPEDVAVAMRMQGHDIQTVRDEGLQGASDLHIGEACRREKRALVTLDLDFSNIRAYPPCEYAGLVVLRPRLQDRKSVLRLVAAFMTLLNREPLVEHLWIVDEAQVRIRSSEEELGGES